MKTLIFITLLLILFPIVIAQEQATATGKVSLTIEPPLKPQQDNFSSLSILMPILFGASQLFIIVLI